MLLDSEGHVKVTDFGLAKRLSDDTRTNSFIGTMEVRPAARQPLICMTHRDSAPMKPSLTAACHSCPAVFYWQ